MSVTYPVPADPIEVEIEVKKSRFIARAACVRDKEQGKLMVEQARQDYPDARHHCWAYLIGNPAVASNAGMNDDGEPGGTAGKPILNVIQHKGVGDVMVVVIRYFGGIKLGVGGLTRAYSAAAEKAFSELTLVQQVAMAQRRVQLDFALEQKLRHWASSHDAELEAPEYGQLVTLNLKLPERHVEDFEAFCAAHGIDVLLDEQ